MWNKESQAQQTDEELMLAFLDGDQHAYEELYLRYRRQMFCFLRQRLGDAEAAEDVFQATFIQVLRKADTFERGRQVRPWLYTIATRQAIDYERRNRRHCGLVRLQNSTIAESGESLDGDAILEDRGPLPDAEAIVGEDRGRIRAAVEALPKQYRQVIQAVALEGQKYRNAAASLGLPIGTVKSRLNQAKELMRGVLQSSGGV